MSIAEMETYENLTTNVTYNVPPYESYKDKVTVNKRQVLDRNSAPSACVIGFSCLLSILALVLAIVGVILAAVHKNNVEDLHRIGSLARNPASSCSEITEDRPSGFYWIQANSTSTPVQVFCDQTAISSTLGLFSNPASSCNEITENRPSGLYWIQANSSVPPVQVYCDTDRRSCSCNSTGGWTRVANIDMTDPNQTCPAGFREITTPRRVCGRPDGLIGCQSTTFPVHGIEYSRVCGRVIGYQFGHPDGFYGFAIRLRNIEEDYISGISLTYGSPRQHVWSFVNAISDEFTYNERVCPCSRNDGTTYTGAVPPFIGEDYFCDSGIELDVVGSEPASVLYAADPLWEGSCCGGTSTCCEFNNPPWFCKQLNESTTDDIELRICENSSPSTDDSPFEIVELFTN